LAFAETERNTMKKINHLACIVSLLLAMSVSHAQVRVGQRQIQSGDMPITLVYPTTAAAQPVTHGPFTLHVAANATPLPAPAGRRQLIVLSHGTAGSTGPDHDLAATLVRAGFVVAQPLHRGDNWQDFSRAGPESWKTRPQDVSETIDALAKDPVLGPQLDLHRVGVHGMSAGGVTGLALAGGQWRMLTLIQHCAHHLEEDIGFCLNGLAQHPMQQALRKGQFAMGRMRTETSAPSSFTTLHGGASPSAATDPRPDPRVVAVSLAVPVGAIFTPESLSRIRIPVGLTTAGDDGVLMPRFHSQHVLKHCTPCTTLSDHPQAGHFDWLSPWPASIAQTVTATQMRGGLPKPDFSPEERQKAFERIAQFFLSRMK
jgi:predicted dienelactone hydrolase